MTTARTQINLYSINQSDDINILNLSPNTSKSIVVPTNVKTVIFNVVPSSTIFYCKINNTASIPDSNDVLDGSASEPNPSARIVTGDDEISVISESSCKVFISFYE